jgi:hypothetical protein
MDAPVTTNQRLIAPSQEAQDAYNELVRDLIPRLAVVSHAPVHRYDFAPVVGGGSDARRLAPRPSGYRRGQEPRGDDREHPHGEEEKRALRESYHSKTVAFFEGRLDELSADLRSASSSRWAAAWDQVMVLRDEAAAAVAAWGHTPPDRSRLPEWGTPECYRFICDSVQFTQKELADAYGVSQPMISKIRRKYGAREAARAAA